MAKRPPLCGAQTKDGSTCRNAVVTPGDRCERHPKQPLSASQFTILALQVVDRVAGTITRIGAAAVVAHQAYMKIEALISPWLGQIAPEYFWDAFHERDWSRMSNERQQAHKKTATLEEKYEWTSDDGKLAMEHVYYQILDELEAID